MAQPWIGVQKLAVVPAFNRQFDTEPIPSDWNSSVMRRVLYDPEPGTGIDRSLRGYISAISYGLATLDVKLFPHAFADGPDVGEAAWRSLPANHGYPYVLCVIPLYDGHKDRLGWSTGIGQNGVTALARVAMNAQPVNHPFLRQREVTGVWAMEVLHAIAGFPDLCKVQPNMEDFDNMTYNAGTHSCAHLKLAAGWLGEGDMAKHGVGSRNFNLHAIGISPPPAGRVSAVRVPARTSANTFYVEARLKSDVYEKGFALLPTGGLEFRGLPVESVIVYEAAGLSKLDQTFLRAVLQVGESYSNPAEGISVTVNGAIDGGMSVHVTASDACPALIRQILNRANQRDEARP
jgi:hypothetical protein